MARSHCPGSRAHRLAGVALAGTCGLLLAGTIAVAPASASPAGTIVLASGTSGTPNPLIVLGASATYALYEVGANQDLATVPIGGGASVAMSPALNDDFNQALVGTLVTGVGFDSAASTDKIDYESANGSGIGSVDVPAGFRELAGSSDGEYVWNADSNHDVVVSDLHTNGSLTKMTTLPDSANAFPRGVSDISGIAVTWADPQCTDNEDEVDFVPASANNSFAPPFWPPGACGPQPQPSGEAVSDLTVANGSVAWVGSDPSGPGTPRWITVNQPVQNARTSTQFDLDPSADVSGVALTATAVGYDTFGVGSHLTTWQLSSGSSTQSTFPVDGDVAGLFSTGTSFVFPELDSTADAGIYTALNASSAPTKIFSDGPAPLAATSVALSPGQAAYSDNQTLTRPIFTRSLTKSAGTLSDGGETLVTSSSTGYGLSLSGTRMVYPDFSTGRGNAVELRSASGSTATIASPTSTPALNPNDDQMRFDRLSGRRAVYPVDGPDPRNFEVYDDVTGTNTAGPRGAAAYALWGNYLVLLNLNGTITRKNLATGATSTLYTVPSTPGQDVFGNVAAWGNTVAWSACADDNGGNCADYNGYLTVAAGASPGAPTAFDATEVSPLSLSSGYLAFETSGGSFVAQPTGGGSPVTLTTSPCQPQGFTQPMAVDGSVAAWLDCSSGGGVVYGTGTPEAAPLPHVSNPPWFLGDPQAPATYQTGTGTWDGDLVTSAVLTTCDLVISQGSTTIATLPCDAGHMALGEATASWDGKNTAGTTVSPGLYTWMLQASNADGALLNYDGSATPVTGAIAVDQAGLPGAPTAVSATAGNSQATVSWSAPATNGGSAVTGYKVQYSSNGGASWTSAPGTFNTNTATTATVTGLTNGTAYVFRVAATNANGTGSYSTQSAPVTPQASGGGGGSGGPAPTPTPTPTPTVTATPTAAPTQTITPPAATPTLTSPPRIEGAVKVGDTVTCTVMYDNATWQGTSWLLDGHRIPGHVSSAYQISSTDFGHMLSCQSAAYNDAGWSRLSVSPAVRVGHGAALTASIRPLITGKFIIGNRLTADPGQWTPSATGISYQWLREGHPIDGATGREYRLKPRDLGAGISVKVTARRYGYAPGHDTTREVRAR